MAQHWPIEQFQQKSMRKLEEGIRSTKNFTSSLKYQRMPDFYKENENDIVFECFRRTTPMIDKRGGLIEVHTKPGNVKHERVATNIYIVA